LEYPVFFIVYLQDNKWRAYIPKKGNTFNYVTKKALGNGYIDEKSDADFEFF